MEQTGKKCQIDDFFTKGELVELLLKSQWRVIRVFAAARSGLGRRRATPGCIAGLDGRLTSLATYVQDHMNERTLAQLFVASDLPDGYRLWTPANKERVVARVRYEVIMRLLALLQTTKTIWYQDGVWWMLQATIDDYLRLVRAAKIDYHHQPAFHDRPDYYRARPRRPGFALVAVR